MERYAPRKVQTPYLKRRCHRCRGTGLAPCPICGGTGQIYKGRDGFGKPKHDRCDGCFGVKSRRCSVCNGEGLA